MTDVDVVAISASNDEHGLTVTNPQRGLTFIALARTPKVMRQRSTLAHELAHVLFDDWQDAPDYVENGDRPSEEVRADAFARHLLAPVEGVKEFLGGRSVFALKDLSDVVQRFLVSPPMAAIVMHEAGLITLEQKTAWMGQSAPQLATRYGWRDLYGELQGQAQAHRAPQKLLQRATTGYIEGLVPASMLARLRDVNEAEMLAELEDVGIQPKSHSAPKPDLAQLPGAGLSDEDFAFLDGEGEDPSS
ncbi:hypothetical protein GCM10028800_10760 [Nesterenkonia populi]